ncbi:MAG: HipA N-terminal domain-containing protein [Prevotellaceae bacterium]|jgi:serine/threonine-protein kinase HipA|nr:HipA N-terminal domain-containing protein [Prevotellaceae bacterium]
MRVAEVYRNGVLAGLLTEESPESFVFCYDDKYFSDISKPDISLTFPKSQKEYRSRFLFAFFFNMLSEGVNRLVQCRNFKIDENDDFGLLLATAQNDTIGAITVKAITNDE